MAWSRVMNVLVTAVRFDLSRVLKAGNSSLSSSSVFLCNTSSRGISQILLRTSDLLDARIGLKLAYQRDQQKAPADRSISAQSANSAR